MWWHQVYFVCFPPSLVSCLCYQLYLHSKPILQAISNENKIKHSFKPFCRTITLAINLKDRQSKTACGYCFTKSLVHEWKQREWHWTSLDSIKYWIPAVLICKWCQNYWLTDMIQHHLHQHLEVSNQACSVQSSTGYQTCHIWTCYFSRIWVYLNISR